MSALKLDPTYMVGVAMQPIDLDGAPLFLQVSSWTEEDGLVHAQVNVSGRPDFSCGWALGQGAGRTVTEAHRRARWDAVGKWLAEGERLAKLRVR